MKKHIIYGWTLSFLLFFTATNVVAQNDEGDNNHFNQRIQSEFPEKVRSLLLTDAKAVAVEKYKDEADQAEFILAYLEGYLNALSTLDWTVTAPDLYKAGFDSGVTAFNKQKIEGRNLSMADFGYESMSVKGTYVSGFETSGFRPEGKEETWWCTFSANARKNEERVSPPVLPKPKSVQEQLFPTLSPPAEQKVLGLNSNTLGLHKTKKIVVLNGYLAPNRGHKVGHMNMYDREFLVIDMSEIK